jgi:uncharacterized protein YggU (UPF0235/DUF167 family)
MRILVKAKTRAKEEKIEQLTQPTLEFTETKMIEYRVSVKEAPVDGKANEAIARLLAKHFSIAPSLVTLVSGHTSKQKIYEIAL